MKQLSIITIISLILFIRCSNADPQPTRGQHIYSSMMVDNRERTYLVNLPPHYSNNTSLPVVIGIHGTGGSAEQFEKTYLFSELAEKEGFIAVYPEGIQGDGLLGIRTWNAGTCCQYAMENNIDDVKFIQLLTEKIISDFSGDPSRIYVVGMSNGGMLAYRLACEMPVTFAAVAVVSGAMVANTCNASQPVPLIHIHDINDTTVPYEGGTGMAGYVFPPTDSVLTAWATRNDCAEPMVIKFAAYEHEVWNGCNDNVILERYLTYDGGHSWPGGLKSRRGADNPSTAIIANEIIWSFFQRYHR